MKQFTNKTQLEVKNLSKQFSSRGKKTMALENINLHIEANEFVCIVGSSGCGKSTLLNIIAGLLPPTSGEVLVDGEVVLGPGPDRGMVFQTYTLFPWLTVADNIAFGLKLKGMPKQQQKELVDYYLNIIGLAQFANSYPKELSGGMKQRVAIARSLANEPEILLMDEPFGALDAQTREQLQEFMLDLWDKTHITVLTITHDVSEAVFLSQRIYVMSSSPGSIREEIKVDLPEQRNLELKLDPDFIKIEREIVKALH